MNSMLRLNQTEQEDLDKIAHQVNQRRLKNRLKPMMDSKVLHELIGLGMDNAEVDEKGNIVLATYKDYRQLAGWLRSWLNALRGTIEGYSYCAKNRKLKFPVFRMALSA